MMAPDETRVVNMGNLIVASAAAQSIPRQLRRIRALLLSDSQMAKVVPVTL